MIKTGAYINGIPIGSFTITFYALIIISGALLALFLSNQQAKKEGYDGNFFNTIFYVAFPSGIVGARIWYVIASWEAEFANQDFVHVFEVWKGGLAIQGGAILGIVAGCTFVLLRRRGTSLLKPMDWAIPTILIAQAIGRWGNFFNQEVFGHAVSYEAWNFLPPFIVNNMQNGSLAMLSGVTLPEGAIAAPLFLVEGGVNLMFYFLMRYGIKAVLGKRYCDGDQAFSYFIAYGIVRLILEPLRNPSFIMGTSEVGNQKDYKSLIMAIVFIGIGVLLIALNHVLHYLARRGAFDKVPAFKSHFIEEEGMAVVEMASAPIDEENTHLFGKEKEKQTDTSIDLDKLREMEEQMKE